MYFPEQKDENSVLLCGRIIHIFETGNNGSMLVTLDCGRKNYPKFFAYGDCAKTIREKCFEGCTITVYGNIQHSNRGNGKVTQTIWCESVELETENVLFRNEFYISGRAVYITETPKKAMVIVKTYVNGRKSIIPIVIFNPDPRNLCFEKNEPFQCCGIVQTTKKQNAKGETEFYESYVARTYC